jgi:hypothetical protein
MRLFGKEMRRAPLGAAAGVIVLAGAVTVATGAIPDSDDGEVHLCYATQSTDGGSFPTRKGEVRVIDHQAGTRCDRRELELVINQQGPPGPSGVSQGYSVQASDVLLASNIETVMVGKTVPAGKYLVNGSVYMSNDDNAVGENVLCGLESSVGDVWETQTSVLTALATPGFSESFSMDGSVQDASNPITIYISCRMGNTGQDAWIRRPTINIVAVDELDTVFDS